MPINLVVAALLAAHSPDHLAAPIVAAERGFAADAAIHGTRLAFLAHFDAGSWLFRPYPTPAQPALARDVEDGSPLIWSPDLAGVSASGDLGFTSGPWTAQAAGSERAAYGHFLTIWKRGDDGFWRVQVDGGFSHASIEQPARGVAVLYSAEPAPALRDDDLQGRRHKLEANDDALRDALGRGSADASAWHRFADADWRAMRRGHLPATGDDAFALAAKDPARHGSGRRRAIDIAASGDLGYTIGGDASCKECGSYYRVWRWHDGDWRLLVDLETP